MVAGHTRQHELATLLPWNWKAGNTVTAEAPSSA
jgi:hypothetical protein